MTAAPALDATLFDRLAALPLDGTVRNDVVAVPCRRCGTTVRTARDVAEAHPEGL